MKDTFDDVNERALEGMIRARHYGTRTDPSLKLKWAVVCPLCKERIRSPDHKGIQSTQPIETLKR